MVKQIWECIITRKLYIERPEMEFKNYTDWLSDEVEGRINPISWGDYILTYPANDPICAADGELIEEVKKN